MINWKDINGLHVISKMEEILAKWFNVELIYADANGKIRSGHLEREYSFKSQFLKVQMGLNFGHEYLMQDAEKICDTFGVEKVPSFRTDSFFKHVHGFASKIELDGEFLGAVMAYPFVSDAVTESDMLAIEEQLVSVGATQDDAHNAVSKLTRANHQSADYIQGLVEIVAHEISTYHAEITKRENRITELNSELGNKYRYHTMIGKSKPMQRIYSLLEKVSNSESSVFIQGENGTGKELVAKAVHFYSPRKDNLFLAVNCSAFNENLLDSELFGHVKGSFTGAVKDKKGLFEQANGGTLFLDEIGDTSLSMQVKLLRVLQEGTFMPVGGTVPKKADVRIIAATNKDLKAMMARGEFREDLYYRINVINVQLPPLRERKEDIPVLIDHFLSKRCGEAGVPIKNISKQCMEIMLNYPWPGNVRQLENEIERLVVLSGEDKTITPEILSPQIQDYVQETQGASGVGNMGIDTSGSLKDALEELEILMIKEGLKRTNFNKSKLAKELGISRASLIMKVEKYGLDRRAVARKAA